MIKTLKDFECNCKCIFYTYAVNFFLKKTNYQFINFTV
jgi:hypothetical protein